ncbi:CoA-binding protein [Pyrobaculum calidifontis]|uniref:CoA-binding domain protein n=1 Tax=Pyrobaculum calidifontis (strain DSM 21063 / JCM 11548 / VA1) TaxID=410359 RepID=A3MU34_PYRCJ|nr:CoA-binding protein [Pyrobaculum calidifontis]ABO08151.1 CoA-binding domain protein [Pyrobaculum calidifontis JCM 11548]
MNPQEVLKRHRTVAVVGASKDPTKWAHIVPKYLKEHGYKIIPVNPTATEILGEKAYPNILEIPHEIEVVNVFRPSEEVPKIAQEVIKRKRERGDVKVLWLQLGIRAPPEVKQQLEQEGITLIEDTCMMETHKQMTSQTQ